MNKLSLELQIFSQILGITKASTKAQVTIPSDVREAFHLKTGDKPLFVKKEDELVLRKT